MEVVEAILHSRGFNFSDVTRATAYFKNRADGRVFTEWCVARGLNALPAVGNGFREHTPERGIVTP